MKGCGWMKFAPALLAVSLSAMTYQVEKKVDDGTEGTLSWALSKAVAERDTVVFAGEFSEVAGQRLPAIVVRPDGSSLKQVFVSARTAVMEGSEGPSGRLKSLQANYSGQTEGWPNGVEQLPAPLAELPVHAPIVQGLRPWEKGMDDYVSLPDYTPQPVGYEPPVIEAKRLDEPADAQLRQDVAVKVLVEGAMVAAAPEWAQSVAAPESFNGLSESGSELPILQMLGVAGVTPDVTEVANFYRAGFALGGAGLATYETDRVLSVSSSVFHPFESADQATLLEGSGPKQVAVTLPAATRTVALSELKEGVSPVITVRGNSDFALPAVRPAVKAGNRYTVTHTPALASLGLELAGEVVALRPRVVRMAPVSAPLPPAPQVEQQPVAASRTPAVQPLKSNLSESDIELRPARPFQYAQTVELDIDIETQTTHVAIVSPGVSLAGSLGEAATINVKKPCPDTDVAVSVPSPRPVLVPVIHEPNGRVIQPVKVY